MIDLVSYRIIIGVFSQKIRKRKFLYKYNYYDSCVNNDNKSGKNSLQLLKFLCKVAAIMCLLSGSSAYTAQHLVTSRQDTVS